MQRDDQTKGRRAMLLLVPCGLALLSTPLLSMPRRALAAASPAPGFRLIVHPDVGEVVLERAFVADIFLKKATRWPNGEPVAAVDLRFGSSVRQAFSERVLRRSASAVRHYWQQRIFTGRGVPPPELDSDDAVVRYVQSRRGAVGYVSEAAATGAVVKVVALR